MSVGVGGGWHLKQVNIERCRAVDQGNQSGPPGGCVATTARAWWSLDRHSGLLEFGPHTSNHSSILSSKGAERGETPPRDLSGISK